MFHRFAYAEEDGSGLAWSSLATFVLFNACFTNIQNKYLYIDTFEIVLVPFKTGVGVDVSALREN